MRAAFVRPILAAGAVAACALVATHARAFTLKVTPIPIVLTGGASSTIIELANESSEKERIEAQTFDWSQTPDGQDKLDPSGEILVFPSMFTISPGSARKLRVGTQGGYGPVEKSFRVIFSEIPSETSPVNGAEVVSLVAKVSIPIFVLPSGAAAAGRIEGLTTGKDRVRFFVRDTGSAHILVDKFHVEFRGAGGVVLSGKDAAGWYVLPGQSRPFEVPLGADLSCAGAASLVVTAVSRDVTAPMTATLGAPPCAQ